jgi:hypothetical protein
VYKEGNAPVGNLRVTLLDIAGRCVTVLQETATTADGTYRFEDVAFGDHEVHLRNPDINRGELDRFPSSRFVYDEGVCTRRIALTMASPAVRADFEVERGWRLSGEIARGNGKPLEHVLVEAKADDGYMETLLALTDDQGCYELLGLRPEEPTCVRVISTSWSPDLDEPRYYDGAILWEGEVVPIEASTTLDVEIPIASLEVEFTVSRAWWPLARPGSLTGTVWTRSFPLSDLPRRGGVRRVLFDQLPANMPVTVTIGFLTDGTPAVRGGRASPREWLTLDEQKLTLKEGPQTVRLEYTERHAVLSRIIWFCVLLCALAALIAPVVHHARRRGNEKSTTDLDR